MVISMERWVGKVAVVTGASAGIGAAIVEQLVDAGLVVIGVARRKERVEELAKTLQGKKGRLHAFGADVTKEEDILNMFQWVKDNIGPIHILVNNAGIVREASLLDGDTKYWREVFDTNVLGLSIATREAVKDMRANNVDGHIVHINSIAGHPTSGISKINMYAASKHAVTGLTESLRQELNSAGSKIKVTVSMRAFTARVMIESISPGAVRTEIFEATALGSGKTEVRKEIVEFLKKAAMLKSEDVADAVMYVLGTPPHVQIHELMIKPVGELF